jgi:NAD(P)H-hydrate repair Nnr-like enzyme with NAD(P)H-hydrate dehydratase domain
MIGTLLSQGLAPVDAARVGAYWHGRAGQLAAQRRPTGVMAGDLPDLLSDAARPEPAAAGPQRIF